MGQSILFLWVMAIANCLVAEVACAAPSEEVLRKLNAQVLRVQVKHNNGLEGLGSAVVIAKNQVITNCHVVTDAHEVEVVVNGLAHAVTAVKPDWHHDLCILAVSDLETPAVEMGSSKDLKYETVVFTVGYPDHTKSPVNTFGAVEEIFPMDDSVVIRGSSPFGLGASGGGVFDETGHLVGIITLKTRGNHANYYYMPVEWVQALMEKPAQALGLNSEKPFWAESSEQRPFFMKVVQPYLSRDWQSLRKLSLDWVNREPNTAESWFYLALAEYEMRDYEVAQAHFTKVLELHQHHRHALEYLNKMTKASEKASFAVSQL